jgi:competence protein ComEC
MPHLPAWPIWKEAPFIRLIIPFIVGIVCEWYWPLNVFSMWLLLAACVIALWLFSLKRLSHQYHAQWWNGVWIHTILFTTGFLLFFYKDVQHKPACISNRYIAGNAVQVTIEEPLCEKKQTFKTVASVQWIFTDHSVQPVTGKILLYFPKDSISQHFQYGNQLLIFKALQPVKNTGNPGCFDYQRYCTFQGIYYQAYLKHGEYITLKIKNENQFTKYLFSTREKIIDLLKKYIPGKKEAGLAEAMLIGYKDDLDKNLVQSYSNTGVVHIIAISGMHLALIYWLLMVCCRPLATRKQARYIQPFIIITGLWLFSCMAGGSPSVMRSAVMFTCLVIGNHMNRKTSVYNSLAASAFILLCYNPFWLWDAGFQLSYAAVLSLAIFYKPIYNLLFIRNKIADVIWKSTAVTLAAQILTVPISVYHFHQFPNLFMLANLLAVPLSGIIIIGEIALCLAAIIPAAAAWIGYVLHQFIYWLNSFIELVAGLPFATSTGLQMSLAQLVCVYIGISAVAWWLFYKSKAGFHVALIALALIVMLRSVALWNAMQQRKLIVYNVPKHSAMDVITGNQFCFKGDSTVEYDDFIQNFYLQPCRLLHRVTNRYYTGNLLVWKNFFRFGHTSVLVIDESFAFKKTTQKMPVDVLILSQNPTVQITELTDIFTCRQVVFDSSNPHWKVNKWQQECRRLGLPCFSVANQGAFVLNLH